LQFEESSELIPFSTDKNEGLVIISCDESLKLDFKTNWNETINYFKVSEIEGGSRLYYLLFPTEKEYNGRRLFILSSGFDNLVIPIKLQAKETKKIIVYDPDARIIGCYYEMTKNAHAFFNKALYQEAKDKYQVALECSDIDKSQINMIKDKIANIDSILIWRNKADTYLAVLDYSTAIEYYKKIYALNSEDKYISNKLLETQLKEGERCTLAFANAEGFFKEKDYGNAKDLYERVVSLGCYNVANATVRLQEISEIEKNKKQLSHVLTYELANNTSIGISTGSYKEHKASGYFAFRFNPDVFEALRSNPSDSKKPELNVSFGWTIKVVKPVWVFFGPGYTGVGEYVYDKEDINQEVDPTLKIYSAVSPELGLLGKIKIGKGIGIALRYTFQYRFALEKETENYIGKTKHVFGIGFCF
jgi:tetratricopeptide (TPR) repeat protein